MATPQEIERRIQVANLNERFRLYGRELGEEYRGPEYPPRTTLTMEQLLCEDLDVHQYNPMEMAQHRYSDRVKDLELDIKGLLDDPCVDEDPFRLSDEEVSRPDYNGTFRNLMKESFNTQVKPRRTPCRYQELDPEVQKQLAVTPMLITWWGSNLGYSQEFLDWCNKCALAGESRDSIRDRVQQARQSKRQREQDELRSRQDEDIRAIVSAELKKSEERNALLAEKAEELKALGCLGEACDGQCLNMDCWGPSRELVRHQSTLPRIWLGFTKWIQKIYTKIWLAFKLSE